VPRACRTCKIITDENVCPICKGTELSDDYSGLLIVRDPENSRLAEKLEAKEPRSYGLKMR